MTARMHPPARLRCQIYGSTSVRCINEGDHWVRWGGCGCNDPDDQICEKDFFSWECEGPHRFGETAAVRVPQQQEAA